MCVAGGEEQVIEVLKMVVLWAVIQRRSSLAGCPCRELRGAGSEGGWGGISFLKGLVIMGQHLSREAVPSRALMLSAGLGPLACKSP